jgi:hypothetical protein
MMDRRWGLIWLEFVVKKKNEKKLVKFRLNVEKDKYRVDSEEICNESDQG